jgi:hypothetical protein
LAYPDPALGYRCRAWDKSLVSPIVDDACYGYMTIGKQNGNGFSAVFLFEEATEFPYE